MRRTCRAALALVTSAWLLGTAGPTFAQSDDCRPLAPDVEVGGDLLATIYSWSTEGFDARDPKDARVLLDEFR